MTVHIKLHGSKAARFEEIKEELTRELGSEPSNAEVVGVLLDRIVTDDPGEIARALIES